MELRRLRSIPALVRRSGLALGRLGSRGLSLVRLLVSPYLCTCAYHDVDVLDPDAFCRAGAVGWNARTELVTPTLFSVSL